MATIIALVVGILVGAFTAAVWLKRQSSAKLNALQQKHQKAMGKLEADHQQRLKDNSTSLKRDYDHRVLTVTDELKHQHQAALDALKSEYETRLQSTTQELKQAHQGEIAVITQNLKSSPGEFSPGQHFYEEPVSAKAVQPAMLSAPVDERLAVMDETPVIDEALAVIADEATFNPFVTSSSSSEPQTEDSIAAIATGVVLSGMSLGVAANILVDEGQAPSAEPIPSEGSGQSTFLLLDANQPAQSDATATPAPSPELGAVAEPTLEDMFNDSLGHATFGKDLELAGIDTASSTAMAAEETMVSATVDTTDALENLEDLDFHIDVTELSSMDLATPELSDSPIEGLTPDSLDSLDSLDNFDLPAFSNDSTSLTEPDQVVDNESMTDLSWEAFLNDPAETALNPDIDTAEDLMEPAQDVDTDTAEVLMAEMGMPDVSQDDWNQAFEANFFAAELADAADPAVDPALDLALGLDLAVDPALDLGDSLESSELQAALDLVETSPMDEMEMFQGSENLEASKSSDALTAVQPSDASELDAFFASFEVAESEPLQDSIDLDAFLSSESNSTATDAEMLTQRALLHETDESGSIVELPEFSSEALLGEDFSAGESPASSENSTVQQESNHDLDMMLQDIEVSGSSQTDDFESLFDSDSWNISELGSKTDGSELDASPSLDEILAMGAGAAGIAGVAAFVNDDVPSLDMPSNAVEYSPGAISVVTDDLVVSLEERAKPRSSLVATQQSLPSVMELRQLADHTDPDVRQEVAQQLGLISYRRKLRAELKPMIPVLGRLSQDHSPQVRTQAVLALGQVQSMQVLPFLRRALQDRSLEVTQAAAIAIRQVKPVTTKAVKSVAKRVKRQAVGV